MFRLSDWDARLPMVSDVAKPWGEYHVLQDFTVDGSHALPGKVLEALHTRFAKLLATNPRLKANELVLKLADYSNNLKEQASADEKILVVQPKQPRLNILSMQYHGNPSMPGHIEIAEYLTEGVIVIGSDSVKPFGWHESEIQAEMQNLHVKKMAAGETFVILPGQWHAYAMPSNMDYVIIREWRITPETGKTSQDREANIVRTYDNSGRGTLGNFPAEIMQQIG